MVIITVLIVVAGFLLKYLYLNIVFKMRASLTVQLVKNLTAMQENWVGKISWRRKRLPTPVFWPGEFHGLSSPWGCKESDTTEPLSLSYLIHTLFHKGFEVAYSESKASNNFLFTCLVSLFLNA